MSQNRILNIYLYGSHVYNSATEQSDTDYIFVVDTQRERECQLFAGKYNITSYPLEYFGHLVREHSVSALECVCLPTEYKIELHPIEFVIDLEKLRRAFSAKASNSWVKAKKKIDVHSEYHIGRKSLFHSLRILDFGIQLAQHGRIVSYQSATRYWDTINKQAFQSWQQYKDFWQPIYNKLKSEFKQVAPIK